MNEANPEGLARSYPAAKLWQVSMQMPIRWWYSLGIWERMSRNSCRYPPIVLPWPHMVSSTGVTVLVAARAEVRAAARRVMAEAWEVWLALPGLFFWG